MKIDKSKLSCTMCGKKFDELDIDLSYNILDYFCSYGSKYDGERIRFNLCVDCFDKVLDTIIPMCKINPIVEDDWFRSCCGDTVIYRWWGKGGKDYRDGMKRRVIVSHSSDFADYEFLSETLDEVLGDFEDVEIIVGIHKGETSLGEKYAKDRGIPCRIFTADMENGEEKAVFKRNSEMITYAKQESPMLIAYWNLESLDTMNVIYLAKESGIPTRVHPCRKKKPNAESQNS